MFWFVYEIFRGVQRNRYIAYLRRLSDDKLRALYAEKWRKVNIAMFSRYTETMQYVEVIREMVRRQIYADTYVY